MELVVRALIASVFAAFLCVLGVGIGTSVSSAGAHHADQYRPISHGSATPGVHQVSSAFSAPSMVAIRS